MNALSLTWLWWGRFWGCFFAGLVLCVAWLAVRDRLEDRREDRRERLARTVQSHPASGQREDWRDEAGVYPVLTDAEIAAFWKENSR